MVLVVTKAVPPSSVAGSGILCSAIVLHAGKPPPASAPACIGRSLVAVKSSSHFEPVWFPGFTWKQSEGASATLWNISAWPFFSVGSGCNLAGGAAVWRSFTPRMPFLQVLLRLICRFHMINQTVRAKMDPTKTKTTKIHRAGLSTTSELGLAVVFMALSWFTAVRGRPLGGSVLGPISDLLGTHVWTKWSHFSPSGQGFLSIAGAGWVMRSTVLPSSKAVFTVHTHTKQSGERQRRAMTGGFVKWMQEG